MGLYAADGSINVSVVDGLTYVGAYAANGSYNVIAGPSTSGLYHPSGAHYVATAPINTNVGRSAPDGSWYVAQSPYNPSGAMRITVVAGAL